MTRFLDWPIVVLLAGLVACSPALDWREVRADDGALTALFPCRPERRARTVVVADDNVQMEMAVCAASGSTYAVAFIDLHDPAAVTGALEALRRAAVVNLGGGTPRTVPFALGGMTPNPQAARFVVAGHLPDGAAVQEHAALFVKGLRIYQASVIGKAPTPEAVETFIAGLKLSA